MYAMILRATGLTVDLFYRRTHLGGDVPRTGPALVVANHPNALIDPVVVARTAGRRVRLLAKEPLFRMPVVSFMVKGMGCLPVYRSKDGADPKANQDTFRAVEESLVAGDCVALFPEGISHDEPGLQPLKTGAARMALGAAARAGFRSGIRVVPMGLVYRDKARFRSEVATKIAAPIDVDAYAARFAEDERAAARALTDDVEEALRSVSLDLETWEDVPLLEAALAIRSDAADEVVDERGTSSSRTHRLQKLADAARRVRATRPDELARVRADVAEWVRRLAKLGLRPDDVGASYTVRGVASFALRNIAAALIGLPIALVGALAYAVPFWLVHAIYLLKRPQLDTAATVKVLASMLVFPLWHVLLTAALVYLLGPWSGALLGVVLPFCALYSRRFFERRQEALRDAAAFGRLFLRKRLTRRLLAERDDLRRRIDELA